MLLGRQEAFMAMMRRAEAPRRRIKDAAKLGLPRFYDTVNWFKTWVEEGFMEGCLIVHSCLLPVFLIISNRKPVLKTCLSAFRSDETMFAQRSNDARLLLRFAANIQASFLVTLRRH
jgi:hypothetical protein